LAMWIAANGATSVEQGVLTETAWGYILILTALTASVAVNALVTGLIVFRIFKVFRAVRSVTTSEDISLGITHGNKLRSVLFVIIESGMTLFAIQLVRLALYGTGLFTNGEVDAYQLVNTINNVFNGITPTIILVRVSLGLSFHDEESLVEAVGSLRFAAEDPTPILGTGSINGSLHAGHEFPEIDQERSNNDVIQIT